MNPKQIEAVLKLTAPKRYDHFIKVVADREEAWGLYNDGWALAGADDGQQVFPLWPRSEYAEMCAVGDWSEYTAKEIELEVLLEGLLPSLKERGTILGVFYTPEDKGVLPELEVFEQDLRTELKRFE